MLHSKSAANFLEINWDDCFSLNSIPNDKAPIEIICQNRPKSALESGDSDSHKDHQVLYLGELLHKFGEPDTKVNHSLQLLDTYLT